MSITSKCKIDNCESFGFYSKKSKKYQLTRGMCPAHYQRWRSGMDTDVIINRIQQHGLSKTRLHSIRKGMIRRCYNKDYREYFRYGGRGITVCDRWLESIVNFYEDMGMPPDGYSIDRIDNDKGYTPENCRWATTAKQNRNLRVRNPFGVSGIYLTKNGSYSVSIMKDNKKNYIGVYKDLDEAISARLFAESYFWY